MKLSVVIPTYDRASDLSELLCSLFRQIVKPSEVVVVDDTPNDTIRVLCEKYKAMFENAGSNLAYNRNPGQRSLTVSRNFGVKLAEGELIMFLDSDVILYPNYIEKISEAFRDHPNALGVQGWIAIPRKDRHYYFSQILNKVFFLGHDTKDSCKFFEYPSILTKIINCEKLSGANMIFRHQVFDEFEFDENLKEYSYMEDVLFSHSVFKKYPKGLYMTPYAICIHKSSETGRIESEELQRLKNKHRKYVLVKLFGLKGVLLYYWQSLGMAIKLGGKALNL
jgi:glycosyltransferase involved in cell wall biosynthesis